MEDGKFVCEDYPSHYVGTNFWYGAILGSEGVGGDRARLEAELDTLKALGMTNLRVLVGGDGPDGIPPPRHRHRLRSASVPKQMYLQ